MAKKKNKNRKGLWIPDYILEDSKLDAANKIIMSEIISLSKLKDGCYASDEHYGELVHINRTSVNKRINKLVELDYISKRTLVGKGKYLFPNEQLNSNTPVLNSDTSCSLELNEGVLLRDKCSSLENTINSTINTDTLVQEQIQNTGVILNTAIPINQLLNNELEELIVELVDNSSIGQDVFFYTIPENLEIFKDSVSEKEYEQLFPILKKIIEIENKLFGK
jgi:hypothetical protein